MECHLKWNVTQSGMSLKLKCHSNRMSLKMEGPSKWNVILKLNVTQNGMPLKIERHLTLNVTQTGMSLKLE